MEGDGTYGFFYDNEYFFGQQVRIAITSFEFDWKNEAPTIGINKDNFSFEFESYIKVTTSGRYLFKLESDGKSELHFNGRKIIDKNNITIDVTLGTSRFKKVKESGAQFMIANQFYKIKVKYSHSCHYFFETDQSAFLKIFWSQNVVA